MWAEVGNLNDLGRPGWVNLQKQLRPAGAELGQAQLKQGLGFTSTIDS